MATPARWYVEDIHDGDTLLLCQEQRAKAATTIKVRLAFVDAPEIAQAPWGVKSRAWLRFQLAYREPVIIQSVAVDQYGRTVAEILRLRDYANLGLRSIIGGYSAAYYCPPAQAAYWAAQGIAKAKRLGIWAIPGIHQTPWVFRREQ